jgi:hypothetical protein
VSPLTTTPAPVDPIVVGFLTLRRVIGLLGFALPFVLVFGGFWSLGPHIQESISAYYYTPMRNVFVGTLFAIGVFMLSYHGFDRRDDVAGDVACLFAVGVALFPTTPPGAASTWVGVLHYACAAALFLTLAFFSLWLFTETDPRQPPTAQKRKRNVVYRVCGWIMLAAIVLIVVHHWLPEAVIAPLDWLAPVFWLESIAILAFGVSWLTKGEAILADR